MNFNRNIFALLVSLILFGCASSGGLKTRDLLRRKLQSKQFNESLELLRSSKFYKKKKTKLLFHLEEGLIYHTMGHYSLSNKALDQSREIYKKLYTESIKGKIKSLIANDNYDVYYGETYERSLINFYKALNYFLIYQNGQKKVGTDKDLKTITLSESERKDSLYKARAEIVEWDSFLSTKIEAKKGSSVFKNDLLAKTFGAYIHESIGKRDELQIALQLYKDAKILLFRNYNAYQAFNLNSKKFKGDFEKLPKLKKKKIEVDYVSKTPFQNQLLDFLDLKILQITKEIRPREHRKLFKKLNAKKRGFTKNLKAPNLAVVFQKGLIPEKIGSKQYYTLERALTPKNPTAGSRAAARLGSQLIMIFAASKLGMIPAPKGYNPIGTHLGIHMAALAADGLAISFELPEIKSAPVNENISLSFIDKDGKEALISKMVLINPVGEIAQEAIVEHSSARYWRLGSRLATKHLTSIIAAIATYNVAKPNMGEGFAKLAAMAQYATTLQVIKSSERADTRYWSTLPADIRLANVYLPKGKYSVKAKIQKGSEVGRVIHLGEVEIVDPKKKHIINFRSFH